MTETNSIRWTFDKHLLCNQISYSSSVLTGDIDEPGSIDDPTSDRIQHPSSGVLLALRSVGRMRARRPPAPGQGRFANNIHCPKACTDQ